MARTRFAALLVLLAACEDDEGALAPSLDASLDATLDAAPQLTAEERASLDVLFVIDNSGSMGPKQQKLARAIPAFLEGLMRGQLAGQTFRPVQSMHVGVVTTNAGGIPVLPDAANEVIETCFGSGDDGLLQTRTDIARDGYQAEAGFADYYPGVPPGWLITPDPSCELAPQPTYQEFAVGRGDAVALSCVARVGVRGCPFEQPLEAMWKALAPSSMRTVDPLFEFIDAGGQGDRGNQGFLRENAALAVIMMVDEDDCSVTAAGRELFSFSDEAERRFGALELRCGKSAAEADLVQPVERYLRGLRTLKPAHPERVVFTAITGVPMSAIEQGLDYVSLLALDEMQFKEDTQNPTSPKPVCSVQIDGVEQLIWPGIRLVQLAQALGAQAVLGSLCGDDYRGALERTAAKIAPLLE
jgi:hypothetical protein